MLNIEEKRVEIRQKEYERLLRLDGRVDAANAYLVNTKYPDWKTIKLILGTPENIVEE